jgi:plasmid stabilization system protein ParE
VKQLIWSPRAAADLEAIREHIAYDSELYAGLMVSRLVAAPGRLIHASRLPIASGAASWSGT